MERDLPPLPGATAVGVIGLGNIGRGVAMSLARGGNLEVLVWDQRAAARKAFADVANAAVATPTDAPILRETHAILFSGKKPAAALAALMTRELKRETAPAAARV